MPCAPIAINPTDRANANKASSIKPAFIGKRRTVGPRNSDCPKAETYSGSALIIVA